MRVANVVVPAAVLFLSLGVARAEEAKEETKEIDVDQAVPFTGGAAEVRIEAGKVVITKILVPDAPSEAELAKATDTYHSYVNPAIVMSNRGHHDADVDLKLTFEDDQGQVILKCERSVQIEEGDKNERYTVCTRGRIKTLDWPRVTKAHVVAHVEID